VLAFGLLAALSVALLGAEAPARGRVVTADGAPGTDPAPDPASEGTGRTAMENA